MSIADLLLPEFDQEMAGTHKTLERLADDKLTWQAHPKSNTLAWVGSHLAEIPGWAEGILTQTSWDIAPKGSEPYRTQTRGSRAEILKEFDKNVAAARAAIAKTTDEEFMKGWSLLMGGETLFTMPRYTAIRTWVLNHNIHHRAWLCSYLRMNNIPVPALYGPSGDETGE